MVLQTRRTAYYVVLLTATTLAFAFVYNLGMASWEGRPQPFLHSLEVVVQTFTTTGYGEDAPWSSPQMHVTVVVMQLAGVGMILTAADVFVVPFLRDALSSSPPTAAEDVDDHVIIATYTARGEALIDELDSRGTDYVVVDPDRDEALALHEAGYRVVAGDPKSGETLAAAGIARARAVVADADDETNASIVLAARQVRPDVRVVCIVEDETLAPFHRYAGASETLSPRQLLGERLASKVTTILRTADSAGDVVTIGDDLEVAEVSVRRGSDLCDTTLADARIGDRTGVNVIGAWYGGEFHSPLPPDSRIDENTILLVTGRPEQVAALRDDTHVPVRKHGREQVLVVGRGETGSAACEALTAAGIDHTVLDIEDGPGVDVVGDATDPAVLEAAGIDEVETVILALGDDTTTIFTSLIVGELNPGVEVLARASETENVRKLYQTGADYVLALATVSGRLLASTLLEDEEVITVDQQIRMVRVPADPLVGQSIAETAIRTRTGCTVIAVERGDETLTDLDPSFRFESGDQVLVVGSDDHIESFHRTFG